MGVPVSRRRQSGSDGRFLSEPEPRHKCREIVSAQSNEEHSHANEDYVGSLCGLAPGSARDEGRRRTSVSRQGSIQPVLEQSGGAGPSESEAKNPTDAGIQVIRQRVGNDFRNRASRKDQEGAVQDGQARRVQCDDDGTVERGTRSLSPQFAIAKHGGAYPSLRRLEFAPEPGGLGIPDTLKAGPYTNFKIVSRCPLVNIGDAVDLQKLTRIPESGRAEIRPRRTWLFEERVVDVVHGAQLCSGSTSATCTFKAFAIDVPAFSRGVFIISRASPVCWRTSPG